MLVFKSCVTLQQFNKGVICQKEWKIDGRLKFWIKVFPWRLTYIHKPQLGPV